MGEISQKDYEKALEPLLHELSDAARWIAETKQRLVVVFEGRDTAGKGGSIHMFASNLNPRQCHVVALPAPSERESQQWYFQRYVEQFPAKGEITLFDRSWYNRAGVEPVMGFCTKEQNERFLELAPAFEKAMVDSGIILVKYWLEVGPAEQTRRLEGRIHDPRKVWKLSGMDLKSYSRWFDYSRARDDMFRATDTAWAPWFVAHNDVKRRGRLKIITHLLGQVPYEPLAAKDVKLPKRQGAQGYVDPDLPLKHIPEKF